MVVNCSWHPGVSLDYVSSCAPNPSQFLITPTLASFRMLVFSAQTLETVSPSPISVQPWCPNASFAPSHYMQRGRFCPRHSVQFKSLAVTLENKHREGMDLGCTTPDKCHVCQKADVRSPCGWITQSLHGMLRIFSLLPLFLFKCSVLFFVFLFSPQNLACSPAKPASNL